MTNPRKITERVLEDYLCCKTKGFLTLIGESGTKTDYEAWRLGIAAQLKKESANNFVVHYHGRTIEEDIPLIRSELTTSPDAILRAKYDDEMFSLGFDALIRDKRSGKSRGHAPYMPVLFSDAKVKASNRRLLGLLAVILSELQEHEPTTGLIFSGLRKSTAVRFTEDDLTLARVLLTDIKGLQLGVSAPKLVLNSHCQVCEFLSRCRAQAMKEDSLSLLRGMDEREIIRLNAKGIFTVNQLSYTFRARRRPKRAKKSPPAHHLPLRALALRENKIFVHGDPVMTLADTRIYLDIEGTPEDHAYYLIGVHTISGGRESRATYWADTASRQDEIGIFVSFLDHLSNYAEYVLLHFGNYETRALERMRIRLGESYHRQIDDALRHTINILSVITAHVYFPTYSNSLKDIASFLGHQWSDPLSTGAQTLVWRSQWVTSHDEASKSKLIRYNAEDCTGLRTVVEFLEHAIASGTVGPIPSRQSTEVLHTSRLSTKGDGWSIFGQTKYVLDEFRAINKLSYFDYQRERVVARDGVSRKRQSAKKSRFKLRPNEVITYRASRCPSCGSRDIAAVSRSEHEIIDLRFMRGGVKRWITRYERQRYRCKRCGTRFLPAAARGSRKPPKYGRGLISWCIYQLLVGGQNLNRIHKSLVDLFGLSIPKGAVYQFKRAVAAYFQSGCKRVLDDLIHGQLIHIDETTINLQREKGYVWVLASTTAVYFFYRRSREGSFLSEMLRKFRGVMVSDFFTAYDSLKVPQQRCLIHLMRDLNEDLLKFPFDDQLKSIATGFSSLLKEIVNTIDTYGLKKRHLNKHKAPAARFCGWVSNQQFSSEPAKNYARRFTKYKDHLFRFLTYDGVPWNNNNAEHAIKHFAKFRRTSNGVVTEETISDYLVILSIYLTCEYRRIDFLKVLLGKVRGDYGFGPKRYIPLRLRATRGELAPSGRGKRGDDTANPIGTRLSSPDDVSNAHKVVNLNRLLPEIFEGFQGPFRRFRYRIVLAPDLWPVHVSASNLEFVMMTFVYILRRQTRQRPLILSARNFRFDKPDVTLGLVGRYVAVSLSDGGSIEQQVPPPREDTAPMGLQKDISLEQARVYAKLLGGEASVKVAQTGRKSLTRIVTTYIPQYLARPGLPKRRRDR